MQKINTLSVAICRIYGTGMLLNACCGHEDRKLWIKLSIHVRPDKLMCKWVDGADNRLIEDKLRQTHFQHNPKSQWVDRWMAEWTDRQ